MYRKREAWYSRPTRQGIGGETSLGMSPVTHDALQSIVTQCMIILGVSAHTCDVRRATLCPSNGALHQLQRWWPPRILFELICHASVALWRQTGLLGE